MKKDSFNLLGCIIFAPVVIAAVLGFLWFWAWLFMLLWNAIVPSLFHGPILTHLQAFLLWLLISMIGGVFRSSKSKD